LCVAVAIIAPIWADAMFPHTKIGLPCFRQTSYHANSNRSDDEYRLLRQNIFERLASGSSVPQEAPLVPIVSHPPNGEPYVVVYFEDIDF
jgi:hypothetical protein